MPRRFVHAADLHLDSPFAGVGSLRPGLDERLRDASLEAWDALVACCIDEQADFLLLAGDLFDRADGSVRGRARLRSGVERLTAAGVRVFVVHGNHDPLVGPSPLADLDGVTVFPRDRHAAHTLELDGERVTVHGASFSKREVTDNLALLFERGDESGLHVGLLHCMVGEREGHGRYAPCSVEDLVGRRMDYWALGHVHAYAEEHAEPPIVYAGALQGRSPRPSERGEHGAVVVEFDGARITDHRRIELDRVRFEAIDVAIDAIEDEAGLMRELERRADDVVRAAEGRLVLLRATLTGRGPLHAQLVRDGYLDQLRLALDADERDDLVWERLRSTAGPAVDLDALRAAGGYAAALLDAFDEIASDPAALAALAEELARPFSDPALAGLAAEDPAARLAAARDLALGLVLEQGEAS